MQEWWIDRWKIGKYSGVFLLTIAAILGLIIFLLIRPPTYNTSEIASEHDKDYVSIFRLLVEKEESNKVRIKLDFNLTSDSIVFLKIFRKYKLKYAASDTVRNFTTDYVDREVRVSDLKNGITVELNDAAWKKAFIEQQEDKGLVSILADAISKEVSFTATAYSNIYTNYTGPLLIEIPGAKYLEAKAAIVVPLKLPVIKKANAEVEDSRHTGVSVGMSTNEVLSSNWGRPQHKNITHTVYGTTEQWVYRSGNYLYFTNGTLTAIQNH